MQKISTVTLTLLATLCFCTAHAATVRVLTDRTETHIKPLFEVFTKESGIQVEAVYVKKGLLPRLQARPTEADIVITKTADKLEEARLKSLLQPFTAPKLVGLDAKYRDRDNMYFLTSYRARAIFTSKKRVAIGDFTSYLDLATPAWKGRVAIRSGYHDYNISLFSQMMELYGAEKTRAFLSGLKANLARRPQGNDRAQIRAIHEKKADVSFGNSYYMAIMMSRADQRPWAESVNLFFPDQKGAGAFIMRSGAALTTATRNLKEASALLEFLVGDFAQYYLSATLNVYSINENLPISKMNQELLGVGQKEVVKGAFKANFIPLRDAVKHRPAVIQILNDLNFDQ